MCYFPVHSLYDEYGEPTPVRSNGTNSLAILDCILGVFVANRREPAGVTVGIIRSPSKNTEWAQHLLLTFYSGNTSEN
jgi:hypothetical protein